MAFLIVLVVLYALSLIAFRIAYIKRKRELENKIQRLDKIMWNNFARTKRHRGALEFYADRGNYTYEDNSVYPYVALDNGEKARKALEGEE